MKKLVIVLLILLLNMSAIGQENERKGYIGMMIGPSFPYDNFANKGQFYDGYAETGLNISLINFGYKIWRNIGITAGWFGIANPIDHFGTDGMWAAGALMTGPLISFPIKDKLDLDIKGMFGFVLLTRETDYSSEAASAFGPGYEAGIMLRYDFVKKWCLMTNLETFNTRLDIQAGQDPKVSIINLSFGIAYRLK